MFHLVLVVAFMIPKTQKSPVLCVIDRALTGIKHFSYITQNILKRYINKHLKVTFGLKYNLYHGDIRRDFLRPPHGITSAAVEINKF